MNPADEELAWEIAAACAPRRRARWVARIVAALKSGFHAGFWPGAFAFVAYFVAHHDVDMPWVKIATVLAFFAPPIGISLAVSVEGFTMMADAIRARVPWLGVVFNPPLAGGLAGAISGIAPGAVGVVVFGTYRGPFAGTWVIGASCSAGALLVAIPAAWRARRSLGTGPRDAHAVIVAIAITTVILGAAAAVVTPLLVDGAFARVAGEIDQHGAMVGAVVGSLGGAVLGLYIGLAITLARIGATRAGVQRNPAPSTIALPP